MVELGSGRAGGDTRALTTYETLREQIRRGELRPGTRVREEEIAAALGVSRTPVREALGRLQSRGLLTNASGGMVVTELSRREVMELYAARGVLEGAVARFAASNALASDLTALAYVFKLFDQHTDALGTAQVNIQFHRALYDAAHNNYLLRMLEELNDSLSLLPSTTFTVPGRVDAARAEHRRILDAVIARDPEAAERVAREHIDCALQARLELLFARGPE